MVHGLCDLNKKEIEMKTKIEQTTSSIPWKIVMKLANISCDADGSWNIVIYPPEKQESISVPIDNTIYANNSHGFPIKPPSDEDRGI